jgi:alkylation response protein AidB-like acyl-CoA dehydrogenase
MARAGLFAICAPASLGGAEADPITTIDVIETISAADGGAGWVLMIGVETTGLGSAAMQADAADEIVRAHPDVVLCGALNPQGRARRVDGGWTVTGQWPFASDCQQADWFWGQCFVEGGARGEALEVLVPRAEYEVLDTWNSPGLRGSGSHDVRVVDRFVPDAHVTRTRVERPHHDGPLFHVPIAARLAYNKVGVATGIARGAIDAFVELAATRTPRFTSAPLRERPRAQVALADAEALVGGARGFVDRAVGDVWETVCRGDRPSTRQHALVRLACSDAVRRSAEAVTGLMAAAGTATTDADHPLARAFRDVHVVGLQLTVSPHLIDDAGRVLLGLEPLSPVF